MAQLLNQNMINTKLILLKHLVKKEWIYLTFFYKMIVHQSKLNKRYGQFYIKRFSFCFYLKNHNKKFSNLTKKLFIMYWAES